MPADDRTDLPDDALLKAIAGARERFDADEIWATVAARVSTPVDARRSFWGSLGWRTVSLGVAAAILAGFLSLGIHLSRVSRQTVRAFATAAGSRSSFVLSDGTKVTLGPSSRLTLGDDYGDRARSATLDGEGYFAVVHDERHPFTVLSHDVRITDVGTEFDVRGYDDEIRVAVARGSVLVGAGRGNGAIGYSGGSLGMGTVSRTRPSSPQNTPTIFQETPLSAGDIAEVANGVPTVTHHADIASATAWLQGGLAFHDTPLSDVVQDISRTFDVKITIADSVLNHQLVTATFSHETVEDILDDITYAVGARYERTGQLVVIRVRPSGVHSDHSGGAPAPLQTARISRGNT